MNDKDIIYLTETEMLIRDLALNAIIDSGKFDVEEIMNSPNKYYNEKIISSLVEKINSLNLNSKGEIEKNENK